MKKQNCFIMKRVRKEEWKGRVTGRKLGRYKREGKQEEVSSI